MDEEKIKPYLKDVFGYIPEIELYKETHAIVNDEKISVVLLILKLK